MDNIWTKIGGRKLIAFVLSLGATVGIALTGNLTDTTMWTIMGLFTAFAGGNMGEHWAAVFSRGNPKVGSKAIAEDEGSE